MSILAGNDDPIIPMMNARIRKFLLSTASLHIYEGHLGLVTKADELGLFGVGFPAPRAVTLCGPCERFEGSHQCYVAM